MGLLDQILGGLAGNASGRSPMGGGLGGLGGSGASGGGMGRVLMSLLPVVLGMLANRSRAGTGMGGEGGLPGGMGQMFGPGAGGREGGLGGLGGLLEQFTQRGYGQQAQSWVSSGPNEAIDPSALSEVFGRDRISQIASQAGVSDDEARDGLAHLLPDLVDHFTPDGTLPDDDQFQSRVDDFGQRLRG